MKSTKQLDKRNDQFAHDNCENSFFWKVFMNYFAHQNTYTGFIKKSYFRW